MFFVVVVCQPKFQHRVLQKLAEGEETGMGLFTHVLSMNTISSLRVWTHELLIPRAEWANKWWCAHDEQVFDVYDKVKIEMQDKEFVPALAAAVRAKLSFYNPPDAGVGAGGGSSGGGAGGGTTPKRKQRDYD